MERRRSHPPPAFAQEVSSGVVRRPCVLYIDGGASHRDCVREALRSLGFRVQTAFGPAAAERLMAEEDFAFLLVDYFLPEEPATRFLRRLQAAQEEKAPRVLAVLAPRSLGIEEFQTIDTEGLSARVACAELARLLAVGD
jgi:CheY-like chemotaxis protein